MRVASCWFLSQAVSPSKPVTRFTSCWRGSSGDLQERDMMGRGIDNSVLIKVTAVYNSTRGRKGRAYKLSK